MKRSFIIALVLAFSVTGVSGQTIPSTPKSPKEVIEQFFAFETAGGRLTPEGLEQARAFFVGGSPLPSNKQIFVVYKDYSVSDPVIEGNAAEAIVQVLPQGQINSALRFTRSSEYKEGLLYHLVLTQRYSVPGRKGEASSEVTGPPEWRIKETGAAMELNVATAIRYVTDMRAKTSDPAVRKNADETLAKLMKLH